MVPYNFYAELKYIPIYILEAGKILKYRKENIVFQGKYNISLVCLLLYEDILYFQGFSLPTPKQLWKLCIVAI